MQIPMIKAGAYLKRACASLPCGSALKILSQKTLGIVCHLRMVTHCMASMRQSDDPRCFPNILQRHLQWSGRPPEALLVVALSWSGLFWIRRSGHEECMLQELIQEFVTRARLPSAAAAGSVQLLLPMKGMAQALPTTHSQLVGNMPGSDPFQAPCHLTLEAAFVAATCFKGVQPCPSSNF